MIIECKTCHARFRLDESKIKGRGARVKCRKCGEQIIVLKESEPEAPAGSGEGEGSLDLGSALREAPGEAASAPKGTPPDNLIHFPKAPVRPVETREAAEKDEVDLAFEQLLERTALPAEPKPEAAAGNAFESTQASADAGKMPFTGDALELPEEPKLELPGEPKFELPEEPKFEPAAEISFEPPAEPGFEPPEEPKFEAPAEFTFESPAEASADAGKGDFPGPAQEPPVGGPSGWTFDEGSLDLAPQGKSALPSLKEERPPDSGKSTDISMAIAPAPAPDLSLESTAFPAPEEAPEAPASEGIVVEGNVTPPADAREPEIPPYREEEPEELPAPEAQPLESPQRHAPAPSRARFGRVAALALVLALLAAAGYLGFTESGKKLLAGVSPRLAALVGGGAAKTASRYEVKNVIGYYDSGAASPKILVIKGQVTNLAAAGKSGIRIFASLLDNTGNVMMEQAVYAGNVLPGAKLKTESRATLEKTLANPLGEHLMNMDVPAGKTIPFMVLFFDAPENIDSYKLEAKDTQ